MKIKDLKLHPYNAVVFREVEGEEFEAFKESIKQNGLQVQIEVTSDNIILCGHQRIKALRELYGDDYDLDDSKIWVRKDLESDDKIMTDILQRMRVIEDNQLRRHLNEGEKTMIFMEKKVLEKELAKLRQVRKPNSVPENFPEQKGDARDKASKGLEMTGKTLEKYEKMLNLADDKEREYFLKTGKILKSLQKKYTKEKQRLKIIKTREANELRKKKLEKQKKKEAKERKRKLEEKIKREKLEKEEEEKLRLEEEEKLRLEESKKNLKVHYKSSEKMDELDESVGLVVTSPPYWKIKDYGQGEDKWEYSEYLKLMKKIWKECYRVLKPSSKLCINIGDQYMRASEHGKFEVIPIHADFIKQCKELGFDYYGSIIWQKASTMNSTGGGTFLGSYPHPKNGILLFDYEFILVFHKPGDSKAVDENIKESSSMTSEEWQTYFSSHWNFVGEKQKDHPAVFPEELPRRLIRMFSFKEEIVIDPFLGSGTTLKVAKELERKGIGYEINEEDFKAIIEIKLYGEEK